MKNQNNLSKRIYIFLFISGLILQFTGCSYIDISPSRQLNNTAVMAQTNATQMNPIKPVDSKKVPQDETTPIENENENEDIEEPTGKEPIVKGEEGTIYLTFDDGPSVKYTEKILDILKEKDIKATFFVVGQFANYYPRIVRRIFNEGHTIACHSMTHEYDEIYKSIESFKADLDEWEELIERILGELPKKKIYRFPGGTPSANVHGIKNELIEYVQSRGYNVYDWNAANGDCWPAGKKDGETNDVYFKRLIMETIYSCKKLSQPCVVLLHDTKADTYNMLEWAIDRLIAEGYTFSSLEELNYNLLFQ